MARGADFTPEDQFSTIIDRLAITISLLTKWKKNSILFSIHFGLDNGEHYR
jgi:hypothetical protein